MHYFLLCVRISLSQATARSLSHWIRILVLIHNDEVWVLRKSANREFRVVNFTCAMIVCVVRVERKVVFIFLAVPCSPVLLKCQLIRHMFASVAGLHLL